MMTDDEHINDARRILVTLLARPDDGGIADIDDLTTHDKLFLVSTCSARMIEVTICAIAGFKIADALEGFDALMASTREHIRQRCERVQ